MYPSEYSRCLTVVETLAKHYLPLIPVDCVSDIWEFARPCLTAFSEPEKVAIGVQASPYHKRRDGSGLLLLRRWKRYQCGLLEVRQSGESLRHHNLNVGFLLCLAVDFPAGGLVCVEQNTGRSCRFTDWECGENVSTAELQPSRVSWQNLLSYISRPVFSRDACFYGLSWRGDSVIRIGPDGSISTFLDFADRPAQTLCLYEGEEQATQILILQRATEKAVSSSLSVFSILGEPLGEVTKLDLSNGDLDVDNRRALCFAVGYCDGLDTLAVFVIDIKQKSVRTCVSLPEAALLRMFVRNDGGLWILTEDRHVEALDPVFI
ncbi:hypothetical protein FOL46_002962 [Perkinsus olseni]|uniref:Uncharacterized protein n=1 Tax=Perkinsus olseni TaxID=32597 RepID=A0A7J6MYC8_PEROL|nr:hypothetical protein FOL46_002962 [Perkinsus olseni]